jgi:hypothetical protein
MPQTPDRPFTVTGTLMREPWEAKWSRVSVPALEHGDDVRYGWVVTWRNQGRHMPLAPNWDGTADAAAWGERLYPYVEAVFSEIDVDDTDRVAKQPLMLFLPQGGLDLRSVKKSLTTAASSLWDFDFAEVVHDLGDRAPLAVPLLRDHNVRVGINPAGRTEWWLTVAVGSEATTDKLIIGESKRFDGNIRKVILNAFDRFTSGGSTSGRRKDVAMTDLEHELFSILQKTLRDLQRWNVTRYSPTSEGIQLQLTIGENADVATATPAVVELIKALNEYHIAAGGNGLVVEDLEIFENANANFQVLA